MGGRLWSGLQLRMDAAGQRVGSAPRKTQEVALTPVTKLTLGQMLPPSCSGEVVTFEEAA